MPPVKKPKAGQPKKGGAKETTRVVSGQLEKKIKKQEERKQRKLSAQRGVVFIKHLPHGFFEDQLKNYFEQFGDVTRLRLCRSRRTGGSKGYAFVEFEYPEVAQVAAETMDNYLMFKKLVKAAYIPPEKQVYNYFKSSVRKVKNKAGKEIFVSRKTAGTQNKVNQHNNWSDEKYQKRTRAKLNKIKRMNEKYPHLGIDFTSILVQPKEANAEEKAPADDSLSDKPAVTDKKKANKKKKTATKSSEQNTTDPKLEDLLGNTIAEDSDDEDFVATLASNNETGESEEEGTSTDEETYGFTKESEDEEDDDDDDDEEDEELDNEAKLSKKSKASYEKSSKVDRFEQLVKRKPLTGGIQKAKKSMPKVALKKGNKKGPVEKLKASAIKEMIKTQPLQKRKAVSKAKKGKKQKF